MTDTAIGIAIILGAWLITNFILKSLAGDQTTGTPWYQIDCTTGNLEDLVNRTAPKPPAPGTPPGPGPGPVPTTCSNFQQLATSNNEPFPAGYPTPPGVNAPELTTLINCIKSKLPAGTNLGEQSTFDKSHSICNLTRGQRTCSTTCSHAVNSCHYGGHTGSAGSLAVDFGVIGTVGDRVVQAAIACGVPRINARGVASARCENAAGANVGCASGSGATHVHVSAPSCDAN